MTPVTLAGILAVAGLACAAPPALLTLANLRVYRRSDPAAPAVPADAPLVGVCIPARNEEANIAACVRSVLDGDDPLVRVYCYDDQSTDATPTILADLRAKDNRVRAVETVPLPAGWNGKQHACWRAAQAALADGCEWLLFTDADVRFSPDCLRRTRAEADRLGAGVLSTFPRQITGSAPEHALVPMMFFLLFGYLPMFRMRAHPTEPSTSAGCGQFLFARADTYSALGTHEAFKDTMHDGIRMPRACRAAGFRSDLFDGSDLASVRMYRGLAQTWRGFAKNAYEGLGSLGLLIFLTVLHLVGHVLPWGVLGWWAWATAAATPERPGPAWWIAAAAALAIALPIAQRALLARRLGHTLWSAGLHPIGIVGMTIIQWHSFVLQMTGRRSWRGRTAGAAG